MPRPRLFQSNISWEANFISYVDGSIRALEFNGAEWIPSSKEFGGVRYYDRPCVDVFDMLAIALCYRLPLKPNMPDFHEKSPENLAAMLK